LGHPVYITAAAEAPKKWDGGQAPRGGILPNYEGPGGVTPGNFFGKYRCKSVQFGAFQDKNAHFKQNHSTSGHHGTENRRFSMWRRINRPRRISCAAAANDMLRVAKDKEKHCRHSTHLFGRDTQLFNETSSNHLQLSVRLRRCRVTSYQRF